MTRLLLLWVSAWLVAAALDRPPRAAAENAAAPPAAPTAGVPSDVDDEFEPPQPTTTTEPVNDELEEATSELSLCCPTTKADLEERLKSLEGAGLNDDEKKQAAALYSHALQSLAVAEGQLKSALDFDQRLALLKAPAHQKGSLEYSKARLTKSLLPFAETEPVALADVEQWAANNEQWLKIYRDSLAEADEWLKRRSSRLAELPKLVADAQQDLKKIAADLGEADGKDSSDAVALAERTALELRQSELTITVKALELEQRYFQEAAEMYQVDRDHWARKVAQKEKRLSLLRDEINRRREIEAQEAARHAAEQAARTRPKALADLANENKVLAERRATVAAGITEATEQCDDAAKRLAAIQHEFQRAKVQDNLEELSDGVGQLLRQQQTQLPNLRQLKRRKVQRDALRSEVQLSHFELQDQRSKMADLDELLDELVANSAPVSDAARTEVSKLLADKRKHVDDLMVDYDAYRDVLGKLGAVEATLAATTEEYGDFIAERVLWIRSCQVLQIADLNPAAAGAAWSLDPRNWRDAGLALVRSAPQHPLRLALALVSFAALLATQRPARRRLRQLGEEASKRNCTRLRLTAQALTLTVVMSLPWAAMLAFVGWSLDSPDASEFVRALSMAVRVAATCLLLLEFLRHLCRNGGLADAHFDWPQPCLEQLHRKLRWLTALGLPLVLWLVGLETQQLRDLADASSSLGRACFILTMLLLAVVLQQLLLSKKSPFRQLVIYSSGGWLAPLQVAWRPAAVLLPAVLAGLAAAGYYYTAQQAALRLLQTVALLLSVLVLGGLTRRWLLVNRRRLAREQAKQRRAAQLAAADGDATLTAAELVDDGLDLAALSEQTQKLVRTFLGVTTAIGLFVIWAEILPALAYLGNAPLILGAAETVESPFTWAQLIKVLVVLALTYVSVRDIPALLELVVLQHLPLDSGFRYALTSLSRYLLAAIGLTAAFTMVGGQWDKIQWLVAAMSVGLGFGLQEIFANFVSGIILLFERPIRVGDIVTLGDKTGVVNRIRMRATTIVDWDRKEYIVPNKDLVTERLLNWTLSDHTNRIEVIVFVSYGSDTERACALLLEAAREQPHVLADPQPVAMFEGFADNGCKLALRCFLPSLESRGATIHQLHSAIDRKFRAAGVEISSPPREMRVRLLRDASPAASAGPQLAVPPEPHAATGDLGKLRRGA